MLRMKRQRGILQLTACIVLLTACGSEYEPYTVAPESMTPPLEALLVHAGPNSTGTGTVAGSGIDCTIAGGTSANMCAAKLDRGKVVTLTADATGSSTFLGWGDACATSGSSRTCTVTVSQALAVSASFAAPPPPPPTHLVTVRAAPGNAGSGTVSGVGINCTISGTSQSGDCSEEVVQGTQFTLTATVTGASTFAGWGQACSQAGAAATCTITVNQATTIEASFAAPELPAYVVNVVAGSLGTGNGTVTGPGITCNVTAGSLSGDCSEGVVQGTQLTLTAAGSGGSTFAGWGQACTGTGMTCTITVSKATTVAASFTAPPVPKYVVQVVAGSVSTGTGTITGPGITCTVSSASQSGDCSEELTQGTQLTLTGTGTGGSTFGGWGQGCSQAGTAATCTIAVSQATTIEASFAAPPPPDVAGFWSGTDAGTNIHYHITLAQSGANLSVGSCAPGDCRLISLSTTGEGWLGASYLDIASLSGTVSGTSVSFTMNLGGKTVSFVGALTSPTEMVGQANGGTMPAQSLTLGKQ
jgi:hypothetical protein